MGVDTSPARRSAVVGRFAPSPTGPLHFGSLVAAVGSYLLARSVGGEWLLRIEDLDTPRVVPGAADDILRTLESLGLLWDREVVFQSTRLEAYGAALDALRVIGAVYGCSCSRAEVARTASAPHPGDDGHRYPGTCRSGSREGKPVRSFRVRVPSTPISFSDRIQGFCATNLSESAGDFVVKRADGPFAYQLAVVVDDAAAGVTQVVRGADLLLSTPRQILLQRLLRLPTPEYFHLPVATAPDGQKLSKRDCAVSLAARGNLRGEAGRLLGEALRFLGQPSPADLSGAPVQEILHWAVSHLALDAVPRGPAPYQGPASAGDGDACCAESSAPTASRPVEQHFSGGIADRDGS